MARFPDSPRPSVPLPWDVSRPVVSGGPAWAPQTRRLTRFNLLSATLNYRLLSWSDVMVLYDFWEAVGGADGVFTFIDFNSEEGLAAIVWKNLFVAQGDGVTTSWDLPTYGAVAGILSITDIAWNTPLAFEDGVPKTTEADTTTPAAGNYGWKAGTGTDGVDKLYAASAPADGVIVTVTATCRRALRRARFAGEKFPFATDDPLLVQAGALTVFEVR